jgi:hypothetical protein
MDSGVVLSTEVVDECRAALAVLRRMADEIAVLDCNASKSGKFDEWKDLWCGIVCKLANTTVVQEKTLRSGMQWNSVAKCSDRLGMLLPSMSF